MARIHVLADRADRSGGAGVYTSQLVRQLVNRQHSLTLVCNHATPDLDDVCDVQRLATHEAPQLPFLWRASVPIQTAARKRSLDALKLDEPDLVIGSAQQLIWAHRRRFSGPPLIYLPHSLVAPTELGTYPFGSAMQRWLAVRTFAFLERFALRNAARTVRFTHGGCEALVKYYGRRTARHFTVLQAPVSLPVWSDDRATDPPRLLFIGRLINTKNVATLVRSLDTMRSLPWMLDVVGEGEELPRLEAEVRRLGLADRIVFHGHQDDVDRWYESANLFVFPSRLESAGLVLLEAMSHGVPTLAIRTDGRNYRNVNHEIIDDGRDGFLARDEEQFTALLAELLVRPAHVAETGRCARRKVEELHSWPSHVDRFDRIIARILESRFATC
jgi:glycosyltransferase involved in cell wall biosynthesis